MERIKEIWPQWEVLEVLGEGGFGKVYKAKRNQYGATMYSAIKVVRIPHNSTEFEEMTDSGLTREQIHSYYLKNVTSLVDEIKMMEQLKSSGHIVGIEDFEVVENKEGIGWTIYIRMELLTNSLNYFKQNNPTVEEVKKMAIHILSALEHCHELNIIHRDIKPANIFISKFNEYKLGDFGVSKEVEKTNATLSQKGTKSYMAPEMVRMDHYNHTVDLYALGLSMYELLNHNRIPFLPPFPESYFPQDREEAMLKRLMGEPFPVIDGIGELNTIIQKACHFDPQQRYQTATEMKKAILDLKVEESRPFIFETEDDEKSTISSSNETTRGMFSDQFLFEEESNAVDDDDITRQIIDYILTEFEIMEGIDLSQDSLAMGRIETKAKEVSRVLETDAFAEVKLPYIYSDETGVKHIDLMIERKQLKTKQANNFLLLDPLQIQCPYCKKVAYLQYKDGYYCPSCDRIVGKKDELADLCYQYLHAGNNFNQRYELIKKMNELSPNNAQILLKLGQTLGGLNQSDQQLRYYLEATKLDPRDAIIYNNLAAWHNKDGQYHLALFYATKAINAKNEDCSNWNSQGVMYSNYAIASDRCDKPKEAFEGLKKAYMYQYANCYGLAFDWNVGSNYSKQVVQQVCLKYSQKLDLMKARQNVNEAYTKYQCHKNEKIYYYFIQKGLFSVSDSLAIGERAIYFNSNGNWYTPYYMFSKCKFDAKGKVLLISVDSKTYELSVGKDAPILVSLLRDIQKQL